MTAKQRTFKGRLFDFFRKINYRYVIWAITLLLVIGAGVLGARRGWAELQRQPEFAVKPGGLHFHSLPESVRTHPMERTLRSETRAALRRATIFDPDICRAIAHELQASPWIKNVEEVRRIYPDRIGVHAAYRRPAGMVETNTNRYMVDEDGYWLPQELYTQPEHWDSIKLPTIVSDQLSNTPYRRRGEKHPALAVGASLTETLHAGGLLDVIEITHIDVTNVGQDDTASDVILSTAADRQIKWGTTDAYERIPSLDRPMDSHKDAEKIAMLRNILDQHPNLMRLHYVDLRFGKIYYK